MNHARSSMRRWRSQLEGIDVPASALAHCPRDQTLCQGDAAAAGLREREFHREVGAALLLLWLT